MQTAINTNNNIFIRADEVAMVLHVSVQTGYKIIRQLNEELQKKGLVVQTGSDYFTAIAPPIHSYQHHRYAIEHQ